MPTLNNTLVDSAGITDTEETTLDVDTNEAFSKEESRRLAAIDTAQRIPSNNIWDFLEAAKAIEDYLLSGEIPKRPGEDEPVPLVNG